MLKRRTTFIFHLTSASDSRCHHTTSASAIPDLSSMQQASRLNQDCQLTPLNIFPEAPCGPTDS